MNQAEEHGYRCDVVRPGSIRHESLLLITLCLGIAGIYSVWEVYPRNKHVRHRQSTFQGEEANALF
jgi:hypothetical protein